MDKIIEENGFPLRQLPLPQQQFIHANVDGSVATGGGPKIFESETKFSFINRIIVDMNWTNISGAYAWSNFANGSALTNGIMFTYREKPITELIKTNHDFNKFCYDVKMRPDNGATKGIALGARYTITKFNYKKMGIPMINNAKFKIIIRDNLSAIPELVFTLQGNSWMDV